MKKGTFVLCIDVELAWGLVHKKKIDLERLAKWTSEIRRILKPVINVLEKYKIPVTWGILGHVVLNNCDRGSGKPHPEMPRASYSWLKEDWYRYDPCSDIRAAPMWYGRDVVDAIVKHVRNSSLANDIGCHSFSHQMFGDPGCDRRVADAELRKCLEIMEKEYGVVPRVFVFPRDYVGNLEVIKENGFIAFRDTIPKLYPCLSLERTFSNWVNTYCSLFVQFMSYYIVSSPHVVVPRQKGGIWAIAGSLAYDKKPRIPLRLVTLKAIKGIDKSIREGKIFCMYTHLVDFPRHKHLLSDLEKILRYVNWRRQEGVLDVKTIEQIATESTSSASNN